MSCGKNFDSGSCVIDILKDIVDAQNDVMHDCTTSCEQSIADLLGDTGNGGSNFDTVPVILYCKDCKPFKGFGSRRGGDDCEVRGSFFFRVKSVDDDGCAILELLFSDDRRGRGDDEEGGRGRGSGHHHRNNPTDPADQDCDDLRASGICITVDLNCFCHVTCLPAAQTL
ncbi:CotY/CotZ family spore coat protein [Halobacillus karajensis]|uniref:Spore coat protein Z n=1 Tax=Halobacillus karajensis TaxID=195088 RepID=A0A024P877_9BACI|nr:CotY/CotZ family spore coat protein [Halobacillus karajensis]CDQ21005.1 Spore coat protein Z [Halobacillus karajensis]CDQ24931.1 Spore coat protein Z [Halobacillus karajensis]CDQ28708.1 Spore coat protein Z [Halobacillus karajensis]